MPFSHIFRTEDNCKEHGCKVNNKNIKKIFKPDGGFMDKTIEQRLFHGRSYKICDCIIVCQDDSLVIVEILCGKLTFSEFKEKKEQLESCCRVAKDICSINQIKKIVLLYDKIESIKKSPMFRKALINSRVCGLPLIRSDKKTLDISC